MTETLEAADTEDFCNSLMMGTFVQKDEHGFVFNFADAQTAVVDADELKDVPASGSEWELLIERPHGTQWLASVRKAQALKVWDDIHTMVKEGRVIEGLVVGVNRGGLIVDVGVRGFVPMSQIERFRVDDASPLLGCKLRFKVTEFDEKRGNLVLSRRAVLEESLGEDRRKAMAELSPGQQFDGRVRTLTQFGAFVEFGPGIQGLLHKDNMSWGRIGRPSDFLSEGDPVRIVILEIDEERGRIALGHKQLKEDPWETSLDQFKEGDVFEGTVSSLADFGAFVSLGEGVEGLLHVTEISWARVHDPREVLKVGDSVRVQIIGIDGNQRRLSLSMKRLEANPWETFAAQHSVGSRVFGKVVNLTDFGAFVEVAPAIDGLIHVSDFSWTEKVTKASDVVSVGQEIEAVILELDVESGRLGLGLKQLTQDPWASAEEIAVPGKRIDVEITRLVDFGAFARITDGIEGLIHISEMSDDRINKASEVVKVGQTVNVLVTGFDRANQRISLSIKRQELGDAGDAREYREEGSSMALGDLLRDRLNKEKTDE